MIVSSIGVKIEIRRKYRQIIFNPSQLRFSLRFTPMVSSVNFELAFDFLGNNCKERIYQFFIGREMRRGGGEE